MSHMTSAGATPNKRGDRDKSDWLFERRQRKCFRFKTDKTYFTSVGQSQGETKGIKKDRKKNHKWMLLPGNLAYDNYMS